MNADTLVEQMLDLEGARTLGFDELLRCADVRFEEGVPTAAVTVEEPPTLLLNRAWVTAHCPTPHHLGTLVLHEMLHIGLGHTRINRRCTALDNIAFDAVINAIIAQLVGRRLDCPRWLALLEETQSAKASPWFLLRPPPRWPRDPNWQASAGAPPALCELHGRLYPKPGSQLTVTVEEVRLTLLATQSNGGQSGTSDDDLRAAGPYGNLLGTHDRTEIERGLDTPAREQAMASLAEPLLERIRHTYGSRGTATSWLTDLRVSSATPDTRLVEAIDDALARVATGIGIVRESTTAVRQIPSIDVRWTHDRRAPALLALARHFGAPRPLLFNQAVERPIRRQAPLAAYVYIDVSGSMGTTLALMTACLIRARAFRGAVLHAFSTQVAALSQADVLRGAFRSDGGTQISACLEHALEHGFFNQAILIITDGYVESVAPSLLVRARHAGLRTHILLTEVGSPALNWPDSVTQTPFPLSRLRT